jgi:hypothetical protein
MKVHSDFFDAARPAGAGWGFGSGPFLLTFAFLQEWSFPACTVNNDKTEHKCTVCRAWRPASKPIGRTSKVPRRSSSSQTTDSDAKRTEEAREWAVHEATAKPKLTKRKIRGRVLNAPCQTALSSPNAVHAHAWRPATSSKDKVRSSHVFCFRLEV